MPPPFGRPNALGRPFRPKGARRPRLCGLAPGCGPAASLGCPPALGPAGPRVRSPSVRPPIGGHATPPASGVAVIGGAPLPYGRSGRGAFGFWARLLSRPLGVAACRRPRASGPGAPPPRCLFPGPSPWGWRNRAPHRRAFSTASPLRTARPARDRGRARPLRSKYFALPLAFVPFLYYFCPECRLGVRRWWVAVWCFVVHLPGGVLRVRFTPFSTF